MRLRRTHDCGALNASSENETVVLSGWVNSKRDMGSLTFFVIRDRYGITQVYVDVDQKQELKEIARTLRTEDVVSVKGKVIKRPDDMINSKMKTGEIEIEIEDIEILSKADVTPFEIHDDIDISEEHRLTNRFLDLRRSRMQKNMILRHDVAKVTRDYLSGNKFLEIETPVLMKSTPEGARDFLVPSRMNHAHFYALPQSPQIYKQLLMVSGFDRYFQLVKCFRDEDLRKDRQPEFTQIDVEMSFMNEDEIMDMAEGLMVDIFDKTMNTKIERGFKRLTYNEAMETYGSDKPDTRFGMELIDIKDALLESDFQVFSQAVENKKLIKAIKCPDCADYSRKKTDKLIDYAKRYGAKGLVVMKFREGQLESSILKFLKEDEITKLVEILNPSENDLILVAVDDWSTCHNVLGQLRLKIAEDTQMKPENKWELLWVTDFPMFEKNDDGSYTSMHHPFTMPNIESISDFDNNPETIHAIAYDLVLNGNEIAGGSLRIYNRELQQKVFSFLGISDEEAQAKFGFLLNALKYGAPPHGGFAFGFDRMIMILAEEDSIRDVIAFPKTQSGQSLMDAAPSSVDTLQLEELGLKIIKKEND